MQISGEEVGIGLAVIGVLLTIYFGVREASKKLSLRQKVGKNSVAIQSGRDTSIK
jgi:hypothetical protein